MIPTLIAALAALQAAIPADTAPATCPAGTSINAPFEAWPTARALGDEVVDPAIAMDVPAMPLEHIALLNLRPAKPPKGPFVSSAVLRIPTAGRYAVAVGGAKTKIRPLWLDILTVKGKALTSAAHGHGDMCSSITKIVEFDLKSGTYILLASELPSNEQPVRVLIVRKR